MKNFKNLYFQNNHFHSNVGLTEKLTRIKETVFLEQWCPKGFHPDGHHLRHRGHECANGWGLGAGLPPHMLCTGTWVWSCVHKCVSADKRFMAALSEHSFPGDHNNVLPPKLVLLLYSLSLQMTAPSHQFPKSGSSSNSPLIHLRRPSAKRVLSHLYKRAKCTFD